MSSTDTVQEPAETKPPTARSFRLFPVLWPLALGIICVVVWNVTEDQGFANSMIHLSVILTVFGWSIWVILRSGWSLLARYGTAGIMLLLLSSVYFQFSPIEVITNGDVGWVGWRWRGDAPDKNLDVEISNASSDLLIQSTEYDYPEFLGTGYWAEVQGVQIDPDWKSAPPKALWKQEVGAGWSSFAVVGDYAFTQEQRGEYEMVRCYSAVTGDLVWCHADNVRFDPRGGGSLGGVGPQATPTISGDRVFSHGATGIINCLDAASGKLIWTIDVEQEFDVPTLLWGKSASPIIVGDLVVVSIGDVAANRTEEFADQGNSLVAFDQATGEIVWEAGDRRSSYATPVLATICGVEQIIVINENFVTSHRADDGKILWEHPWEGLSDSNASTSQPIPLDGDRLFLSKGYGIGAELVQISRVDEEWKSDIIWKKPIMKTKMGNVVLRDGHVFGLNEVNLMCIELNTGKKKWIKRRRPSFGHGQILLTGEHILVLTEEGEVVLVAADTKEYQELASFPAIEGVTWNNPTLTGSKLLVRNAEWAACYELPLLQDPSPDMQSTE